MWKRNMIFEMLYGNRANGQAEKILQTKNYLVLLVCFFLTPILREVIQFNEQTFLNGWAQPVEIFIQQYQSKANCWAFW